MHELGHVLGLAHNDQSGSVMYHDSYVMPYNTELAWYETQAVFYLYFYYRASLKTLIGALRKSGLATYTRIPLVNPFPLSVS